MTIAAKLRDQIAVDVGDVLEATVQEGAIVLLPKAVIYRAMLADRLDALLARSPAAAGDTGKSEQQVLD